MKWQINGLPLFSFVLSCYNKGMNQYQKKIVKGTIYSLLSGLIWGICGILGEYFFTHYQVSSGWITSMRLTLAGSLVLVWSAMQLKSQVLDIWRDKKDERLLGKIRRVYEIFNCRRITRSASDGYY